MRYYLLAWLCISSLLLNGCATKPKIKSVDNPVVYQQHLAKLNNIHDFDIAGKIGVIYQGKGSSGRMQWAHTTDHDLIEILSPLGGKVAVIEKTPNIVTLTDNKNQIKQAPDVATLTTNTLGWPLPLTGLSDWVLGKAHPQAATDGMTWDALGRLLTLDQQGWHIEYTDYAKHGETDLPSRIRLKNDKVRLKLIIKDWQLPNQ